MAYDLDEEEQEMLDALENGEFKSAPDLETRKIELKKIAENTLNRTRDVNVHLPMKDIYNLKMMAEKKSVPYQTLVASILHESASR